MFLKKKYRVTTRGKVVFSLTGLLLLYGIYMILVSPGESQIPTESTLSEENTFVEEVATDQKETIANITDKESGVTVDVGVNPSDNGESTKIENCTTNQTFTSEEELKLIEAAGFMIYYEPNAYYVPESDIALIAEFVSVAKIS